MARTMKKLTRTMSGTIIRMTRRTRNNDENLPVDIWLRPCTRISASSQSRADSILNFPPLPSQSLSWFCWLVLLLIYLLGRLRRWLQSTKDLALEEATTDVTGPSSKLVWDCCRTAHCFPSQRLVFLFFLLPPKPNQGSFLFSTYLHTSSRRILSKSP